MKPGNFGKNFGNTQKSNFMKICPVGAEFAHAEVGHTDIGTWRS